VLECRVPLETYDAITLGHGGGGKLTQRLIGELLLPAFNNAQLAELHDGAFLDTDHARLAFTTDSYVVSPYIFPGGDIGSLAVHGTANDLAMCGARPLYLSLAFILEEGLPIQDLKRIVESIRNACRVVGLSVVTGDTKVVERGKGDGIFINTTGIGAVLPGIDISPRRVRPGDRILLSGPIAEHGIAILSVREGLSFQTELTSDSTHLWPIVTGLLQVGGSAVHVLRDATRGGVASVVNEIAQTAQVGIVLDEAAIPVRDDVRGACEILGLDPLYVANEGKFLTFVAPEGVETVLETLRAHPLGEGAELVGEVTAEHPGVVRMRTLFGGSRVVDLMSGEQLPRIC
jgi:hydrogenase expression/formation protein HypE